MRHASALVALLLCAACSSEAPPSDAGQSVGHSTASDSLELAVELSWSTGEGEDYDLDDSVTQDEDWGEYGWSGVVKLGPISECNKPAAERAADAVCSWDGPSNWWNIDLDLRSGSRFDVDFWAGDADTDGGLSLPAIAVPTTSAGPLRLSMSPDNAGGSWGSVSATISRIEQTSDDSTDEGSADDANAACCVVCSAGVACGDGCIAADAVCHQPSGCACQGE
jgi:hypothetical protein